MDIQKVTDAGFAKYGRVISGYSLEPLLEEMEKTPLPEGVDYVVDAVGVNALINQAMGLVKYNGEGGYVYNSHENYAAFQEATSGTVGTNGEASDGYFDVYDSWALTSGGSPSGQFFPPL